MPEAKPIPPCKSCTQMKKHCRHRQIKKIAKGCHLLMSYIVGCGTDYNIVLGVSEVIEPGWYTRHANERRVQICKRIFPDLQREERDSLNSGNGNIGYNRSRKTTERS